MSKVEFGSAPVDVFHQSWLQSFVLKWYMALNSQYNIFYALTVDLEPQGSPSLGSYI